MAIRKIRMQVTGLEGYALVNPLAKARAPA
jgi:hypothetical protein